MKPNKLILLTVAAVAAMISDPAQASIMDGPAFGLTFDYIGSAANHVWDTSDIRLVDTANGFKITGSLHGTISEPTGSFYSGAIVVSAQRKFDTPVGTGLTVLAAQSGDLVVDPGGPINVTDVSTVTRVLYNSTCSVSTGVSTGGDPFSSLVTGTINAGPNVEGCPAPVYQFFNVYGALYYTLPNGGSGTISVNFGNSLLGEADLEPDSAAVPEPAALVSTALALVLVGARKALADYQSTTLPSSSS